MRGEVIKVKVPKSAIKISGCGCVKIIIKYNVVKVYSVGNKNKPL